MDPVFTLDQLCTLADCSKRTVRYYVQLGLVDRPVGETRAARYGRRQLEQLLQIKQLSEAGISLERIREVLDGQAPPIPRRACFAFGAVHKAELHVIAHGALGAVGQRAQLVEGENRVHWPIITVKLSKTTV